MDAERSLERNFQFQIKIKQLQEVPLQLLLNATTLNECVSSGNKECVSGFDTKTSAKVAACLKVCVQRKLGLCNWPARWSIASRGWIEHGRTVCVCVYIYIYNLRAAAPAPTPRARNLGAVVGDAQRSRVTSAANFFPVKFCPSPCFLCRLLSRKILLAFCWWKCKRISHGVLP